MSKTDPMKAMNFEYPEAIPVSLGILPAAWMKYRDELNAIAKRHPTLLATKQSDNEYDSIWSETYKAGRHIDAWGCVWDNVATGREAIVTGHPVPTREAVHTLQPPATDVGLPHGFMYLRLGDLRGFEELMIDFAEEPPELQMLIDMVLNYNLRQRDLWLAKHVGDGSLFGVGDDLGTQHALPMSPDLWRKYLKPCYHQLYQPVRQAGHGVYMHTDGHIYEIIPDLVECGVTVINPQFRANGLDNLVRVCKGKVCVDLDLDRQMFPFCTPADIDRHVRETVEALGSPAGGLWLRAEADDGVPLENIEALCMALEKYSRHFSHAE
ncbi:MAG: uroporphyrinogen decarboxylase family protein [bacterium]